MLTDGTDFPITKQLIISNKDLYEKLFDIYDLNSNHDKIFEFAKNFYQVASERGMNDHERHDDVGRGVINHQIIQEIVSFTEDTEYPISKQMIISNLKLFTILLKKYDFNDDDKYHQMMLFAEEFYNIFVNGDNDPDDD